MTRFHYYFLLAALGEYVKGLEEKSLMTRERAYEFFGLRVGATPEQIENAFKKMLWKHKQFNPNRRSNTDEIMLERAHLAYEKLMSESEADEAMIGKNGGIDRTSDKALQVKTDDQNGIKFKIDPAMLQQLQNAPGFVPMIVNIQPLTDLKQFLGIASIQS